MTGNWFEQKPHGLILVIVFILAYFLLMLGNGIVSLTHPDEVFYIQSAKEMLAHNSWLTPMIFDDVQFEKPFIAFTLFMLAIKMFGLTAFAGRFFPSLFGIIGVGVVYWISWILFRKKRLSFFSSLVLSSSFIYLGLSRAVLTDMIFSIFVSIAVGFFCFAYYCRKYKNLGIVLFFALSGIAVLTKGLLGLLFPGATAMIFLVYKRELSFFKCRAALWGLGIFFAIALPWHILMYSRYGQWFLEEYFYNVHWRRVLAAEHGRLDNWYFYIALMFVGVIPWFLFWGPTLQTLFLQFRKKMAERDKLFFLLSWVIAVYIFVQPVHSKLGSYIFPVFPAIAILLAYTINDLLEKVQHKENFRVLQFCGYSMSVILICVGLAGVVAGRKYIQILISLSPIYAVSSLLICIALLIILLSRMKLYTQMVISFTGVTFALLILLFYTKPYIEPWVSCKEISGIFDQIERSNAPILTSKFYVRGVRFYTDRPVAVMDINGKEFWSPHPIPSINKDELFLEFVGKNPVTWAILKEGNVEDVHRILKNYKYKITQLEGFGGKYILKIEKVG